MKLEERIREILKNHRDIILVSISFDYSVSFYDEIHRLNVIPRNEMHDAYRLQKCLENLDFVMRNDHGTSHEFIINFQEKTEGYMRIGRLIFTESDGTSSAHHHLLRQIIVSLFPNRQMALTCDHLNMYDFLKIT